MGLVSILLALATCAGPGQIDVTETARTTIPKGSLLEQLAGDLGFADFATIDLTQSQELQNQGVERHQIEHVYLQRLMLRIVDDPSEGRDFTFIDSIAFFAEADGLPRRRIAHGGPFEEGAREVGLDLDDVDLAPYATAPSMTLTTEVSGRRPSMDTTVEAEVVLRVHVNVGGLLCGG